MCCFFHCDCYCFWFIRRQQIRLTLLGVPGPEVVSHRLLYFTPEFHTPGLGDKRRAGHSWNMAATDSPKSLRTKHRTGALGRASIAGRFPRYSRILRYHQTGITSDCSDIRANLGTFKKIFRNLTISHILL